MKTKRFLAVSIVIALVYSTAYCAGFSWQDASNFYGQTATVSGKVVSASNSNGACLLNLQQGRIVISASDISKFPKSAESYYSGKEIKVTGLVGKFEEKPVIMLQHPSQIEILQTQQEPQLVGNAKTSNKSAAKTKSTSTTSSEKKTTKPQKQTGGPAHNKKLPADSKQSTSFDPTKTVYK
jgi:hypothetical protein